MGRRGPYGRINRNKSALELEADALLEASLKDKHSNKSAYCDILSDSQLARRQRRETPFSDLSIKDKLKIGVNVEVNDDE